MNFLVVEILDESDQFILGRYFIRNFDVTIDLNNAMFRIRNPERKYVIKPVNLIMANENKAPVFLSRRVRLKANEAAIVSLRIKNFNELSDNKQVCIVPNPNSQSAAVLGRSFSITKSGLCVNVLLNTLDIPITVQRGRKLGYALPVKTRYVMTEKVKENDVLDCPNHRDKICILRRLKKIKDTSGLVKSLKSETDDGLLSCSNFPERPSLEEMEMDKPVLPEIDHLRGKVTDEQLEANNDVLERNEDLFSKHKADIGCCNFVEHEIELEESAVPHREGARRMTPHKLDACRKEIETLLDKIEPSKSPWACGVVMAKKKGDQLRFFCDFRYPNSVTVKDAYPIPRIDESLSKLGDAKFFTTLDLGSAFWQVPLRKQDRDKTGLACMKRSGLKCKPSKCEIPKDSIKYLGRMVDRHGIRPDTDAVEAVLTWKLPKMKHQLMSFLGFATRPLSSRLGARVDSRDSSRSRRTRQPGSTPMEAEEVDWSTPQSSVVSSVVVVDDKRMERPAETSRPRYLERIKELDLEDLECRQELAEVVGLKDVSHEDLSGHHCVDWLKAHQAHFPRVRMMETADLTGIPLKSIMGPINYRPLKLLGSPGLILEPPKHRTSIARIRVATPAQLRLVDKLLEPKDMGLPDAAYGKPCGNAQVAKILAVYDRSDPGAARVIFAAGLDFEGTSPKLF